MKVWQVGATASRVGELDAVVDVEVALAPEQVDNASIEVDVVVERDEHMAVSSRRPGRVKALQQLRVW
jgi:hypothetical protein